MNKGSLSFFVLSIFMGSFPTLAKACPNLSGQYRLTGEAAESLVIEQSGCSSVEISNIDGSVTTTTDAQIDGIERPIGSGTLLSAEFDGDVLVLTFSYTTGPFAGEYSTRQISQTGDGALLITDTNFDGLGHSLGSNQISAERVNANSNS